MKASNFFPVLPKLSPAARHQSGGLQPPATPGPAPEPCSAHLAALGLVQAMGPTRFRAREGSPRWWRPLTPIL